MTALPYARLPSPLMAGPGETERPPGRTPGLYFAGVVPFPASKARILPASPARGSGPPPPRGTEREYEFLGALLDRAGLSIAQYQSGALLRRLPACLRALGVKTVEDAVSRLAARPALAWGLLDVVLLGVTQFCRDPAVFQHLRATLLPELAQAHARPRIWSAGCSEGQELYSVAACLAELELLERCDLLGTDCRPEAVARARLGEYAANAAPAQPAAWQRPHLLPAGDRARIHPRLRVATAWRVGDLLGELAPGPWNLVLCRNVAIYLQPSVANDLWLRLAQQLAPGGYLVTGKAENPATTGAFERVASCIYRVRPTPP